MSKIFSTILDLLQLEVLPLPPQSLQLAPQSPLLLPRVRFSQCLMRCLEEPKKEEEADVDMGGLFGDDY